MGEKDYDCTPWGMPSYSLFGWQKPCYLVGEGYYETYDELLNKTEWSNYGKKSGNPKCTDCMVHCGYEPTAADDSIEAGEHLALDDERHRRQLAASCSIRSSSRAGRKNAPCATPSPSPARVRSWSDPASDREPARSPPRKRSPSGRPRRALVIGTCGALAPSLRVADVLLFSRVRSLFDAPYALDPASAESVFAAYPAALSGIHGISVDRIATRASEKRALSARFQTHAVDMETYEIVRAMHGRRVPVAVVRVVSDDAAGELPDLNRALTGSGEVDPASLALALLSKPVATLRLARSGASAVKKKSARSSRRSSPGGRSPELSPATARRARAWRAGRAPRDRS